MLRRTRWAERLALERETPHRGPGAVPRLNAEARDGRGSERALGKEPDEVVARVAKVDADVESEQPDLPLAQPRILRTEAVDEGHSFEQVPRDGPGERAPKHEREALPGQHCRQPRARVEQRRPECIARHRPTSSIMSGLNPSTHSPTYPRGLLITRVPLMRSSNAKCVCPKTQASTLGPMRLSRSLA